MLDVLVFIIITKYKSFFNIFLCIVYDIFHEIVSSFHYFSAETALPQKKLPATERKAFEKLTTIKLKSQTTSEPQSETTERIPPPALPSS